MTDSIIPTRFLVRGGTAANLATVNETPRARELVYETDTGKAKLGNGSTAYNSLDYIGDGQWQPLAANLTQIGALADPSADRLLFWDDSAGEFKFLTLGTNLSITGTTIDAASGGGGGGSGSVTLLGSVSSSAAKQGGTAMPYDNTKPQIGEGNAFTELDLTVTPASASSNLIGVVFLPWITASAALTCVVAAYRDSTGDPVGMTSIATTGNEYTYGVVLIYKVPSTAASSTTFKVRYGPNGGSSMSINRGTSSSTLYGNAGVSLHMIFEVAP